MSAHNNNDDDDDDDNTLKYDIASLHTTQNHIYYGPLLGAAVSPRERLP